MGNRVIHFEVVGKDGPGLQQFYTNLFGWSLNTDNPNGYGLTSPDETGIVVGIGNSHDGGDGHVTSYVRVADVDATLARAVELGGRVLMPKFNAGPDAVLGIMADPEGHVIGLSE